MNRADMKAIARWMEIRAQHGYRGHDISTPRGFYIEAEHSMRGGLLGWLLDGNEPTDEPPPTFYSRPWHQLYRDGEASGTLDMMPNDEYALIGQSRWLVTGRDGADYLIKPREDGSLWRLVVHDGADEHGQIRFNLTRAHTVTDVGG